LEKIAGYCMNNEPSNKTKLKNASEMVKNSISGPSFTNGLAIILIIGSIVAILVLIGIHMSTVSSNQNLYKEVFDKAATVSPEKATPEQLFNSFQNFYRETNTSNMNLLSILLPVVGTWIGAILAFYYGNKNLQKLSENYEKTVKAIQGNPNDIEKLRKTKVKDVLDAFPSYKTVNAAKMSEAMGPKVTSLGRFSTVLLTDDAAKPLGFLYLNDVTNSSQMTKEDIMTVQKSFKDFFVEMKEKGTPIKDEITSQEWSDKGVPNYAQISMEDTLEQAQVRISSISSKQSVRGLILDKDKKILGLITVDLFSKVMLEF
jgi:hypothetical protein